MANGIEKPIISKDTGFVQKPGGKVITVEEAGKEVGIEGASLQQLSDAGQFLPAAKPTVALTPQAELADIIDTSGVTDKGTLEIKPIDTEIDPTVFQLHDKEPSGDFVSDFVKDAFGKVEAPAPIEAPSFSAERTRLEDARDSRVRALDATFSTDLATTRKRNEDVGNALKARLLKLGVSPSDSAWSNAEAGQLERDQESETKLRNEYLANKAKIEADSDALISTLAMNEATLNFNAAVQNIQTKLTTQAQGIDLFTVFSNRDQSEKDREQRAFSDLLQHQGTMAGLEQDRQELIAKNFIQNAQEGLFNVSDEETLKLLTKMEQESPFLQGLVGIASSGLTDRLDRKAQEAADLALTEAQTVKTFKDIEAGDKETETKEEFAFGRSIIEANPNVSRQELKSALLENTNLETTEINSLLDEEFETRPVPLSKDDIKKIAKAYRKKFDKDEEAAKAFISKGQIIVDGKTIILDDEQIARINQQID